MLRASEEAVLLAALCSWMNKYRLYALTTLSDLGIPPAISSMEPVAEFGETGAVQVNHAPFLRSPLSSQRVGWALGDEVPEGLRFPEATEVARLLVEAFGNSCYFQNWGIASGFRANTSMTTRQDFEEQPLLWVERNIVEPVAATYGIELADLSTADEELALVLAREVVDFVRAPNLTHRSSLPFYDIDTEGDCVQHDWLTLRRATPRESGEFAELSAFARPRDIGVLGFRGLSLTRLPSHVLFVDEPVSKDQGQPVEQQHLLQRTIVAFELLGWSPQAPVPSGVERRVPDWASSGIVGTPPLHVPTGWRKSEPPRRATSLDIQEICELTQLIQTDLRGDPRKPSDVAIQRFMLGAARERVVDRLIDFVIALEAVFLEKGSDLGFRFRHYGAAFLATDGDSRSELAQRFKLLYDLRSRLVHGSSKYPAHDIVKSAADDAYELCRLTIVKGLREGWPTQLDLEELVVGR